MDTDLSICYVLFNFAVVYFQAIQFDIAATITSCILALRGVFTFFVAMLATELLFRHFHHRIKIRRRMRTDTSEFAVNVMIILACSAVMLHVVFVHRTQTNRAMQRAHQE